MSEIKIVLIEDHDLTRMGLRAALQSHSGLEVIGEAANATQGLKLLQTTKPDVAVVDIGLPDMDGIELTRKFRSFQEETADQVTKILILTMEHSEDAVLAAFAAGADSYYMKDTSIDRLMEAIKRLTKVTRGSIQRSLTLYCGKCVKVCQKITHSQVSQRPSKLKR